MHDKVEDRKLTKCEQDLLDVCHDVKWGKVEVTLKNGQPVFVSIRKDKQLGEKPGSGAP